MTNVNLTALEIAALRLCLNYDNRESQLSDNYSNAGHAEFMSELKLNRNGAAALIGSLEKKGMGFSEATGCEDEYNVFWLSELAVNTIFDIIEKENAEKA